MFRDGDFGDQPDLFSNGIYLPYIPTGADDPNVDFAGSDISYEEVRALIDAAGLGEYAGGYAPKNSGRQPWVTTMDLSIRQEIPGFFEGHKVRCTLTLTILPTC